MLEEIKLYQELQKRESKYLDKVKAVYEEALAVLPKINRVFANYTGHGIEHSINVMQYMYDIVTDISLMSALEITCLIYVALLHDVGMVVSEKEIEDIEKDELIYRGRKYSVIYKKYKNENIALQEYVRPVHGERASNYIMNMRKDLFIVPGATNCNFREEIAKICHAHTMNQEWLLQNLNQSQVKGEDAMNAQYVAMLLRVADYLDIDEKRAPMELYQMLAPAGFGDEEWRQHYIIENKEKIGKDNESGNRTITIYGQCNDSKIHRKFLRYLSDLSEELLWCTGYTRKHFERNYWILLQPQVDNKIQTRGFEISDLKMNMDFHAVIKLLMGEKIYGDKKYGLRELIQNAVDACRVMAEEAEQLGKYRYAPYIPKIQVILDYKDEKMIVMDNGIGMEYDILKRYFLNIGKSYYKSDEFLYQGKSYSPIGTFGIGFLSCFMLSDSVVVETKHYIEQEGFTIELERDSEFVCKKNEVSLIGDSGTAIILSLKSVLQVFEQGAEGIKEFLERTFLKQGVSIHLIVVNDERTEETVNLMELEELNPNGMKLDSFLNGISAYLEIEFANIKVSKKFSDLCTDELLANERELVEYDYTAGIHYVRDLEGGELEKYIENGCMMVIKVQGVKEAEKDSYERWKEWNSSIDYPPKDMLKTVYVPIKYDESLLKYRYNNVVSMNGGSGAAWFMIHRFYELETSIMKNDEIDKFLIECKMLPQRFSIDLGIFPIINIGNDRYIEHYDVYWQNHNDNENIVFWHGIQLDKGKITLSGDIVGISFGKCVINIISNDVSPNVARDNLAADEREKVTLAIERAAYQYVISKLNDYELRTALQSYVDSKYPADNPYCAK